MAGPVPKAWAARNQLAKALLFGVPAAVLAGSYGFLAARHQTWNLFPVVVHENGQRTLLETIFYFRHFLRELPVCVFLAAAVAIAAAWHSPLGALTEASRATARRAHRRLGLGLVAGLALVLGIVWWREGANVVLAELMQDHTRGEVREFGSHWRYHWLHLVDALPFCFGLALVVRGLTGAGAPNAAALRLAGGWIVAFLAVTVVTGSPLPAFTNPLYLAHQAREIETHRVLTLCLALGTLWWLERRLGAAAGAFQSRLCWRGLAVIAVATLLPLWIMWRLRQVDVPSLALRKSDLRELAAAHHFEHCLDYAFVAAFAAWLYLAFALRQARRQPSRP